MYRIYRYTNIQSNGKIDTHMHTYTCTHTHTHTQTLTYTYKHTQTHTHKIPGKTTTRNKMYQPVARIHLV